MEHFLKENVTISHPFMMTTAEILYFSTEHPRLIKSFIWQDFDNSPDFPKLRDFLEFFGKSLDGKVHSVYVVGSGFLENTLLTNSLHILTIH